MAGSRSIIPTKDFWCLICGLWVAAPILAWGAPVAWLAALAHVSVLAVGLLQPLRRPAPVFGWLLLGSLGVYLVHCTQPGGLQRAWIASSLATLAAGAVVAERADGRWLRQAVVVCAWAQLPVMAWQALGGVGPWPVIGDGLTGTVARRGVVAALLALGSLWSTGARAGTLALAAGLSGSCVSLPALARLVWERGHWRGVGVSVALGVGLLPWLWPRLGSRWDAWHGAGVIWGGWLTGWGFLPLPGGFRYDIGAGRWGRFVQTDYHSAWLDWVARFGLPGALMLVALGLWTWRRSRGAARWTWGLVAWAGCWQSVEVNPVLLGLGLIWLVQIVTRFSRGGSSEPQTDGG